tara:strand:- start:366 stop:503 length:138 start_codon:yes stop_codon:yes gene_type:complete
MIQYIEILWEPLTILFLAIVVFYGFSWFLGKFADLIGFEDDDEDW